MWFRGRSNMDPAAISFGQDLVRPLVAGSLPVTAFFRLLIGQHACWFDRDSF